MSKQRVVLSILMGGAFLTLAPACGNSTGPVACLSPVSLKGTWHGTVPHAALTVTLGAAQYFFAFDSCAGPGVPSAGPIISGMYADSTFGAEGSFPGGQMYFVNPNLTAAGSDTVWSVVIGAQVQTQVDVTFSGVFGDTTTSIPGTLVVQNVDGTRADTVAMTLIRQ